MVKPVGKITLTAGQCPCCTGLIKPQLLKPMFCFVLKNSLHVSLFPGLITQVYSVGQLVNILFVCLSDQVWMRYWQNRQLDR